MAKDHVITVVPVAPASRGPSVALVQAECSCGWTGRVTHVGGAIDEHDYHAVHGTKKVGPKVKYDDGQIGSHDGP